MINLNNLTKGIVLTTGKDKSSAFLDIISHIDQIRHTS